MLESISIVIPAFNEAKRICSTLRKIDTYFEIRAQPFEIIVVDDGSTDNTADVVLAESQESKSVRLLSNRSNKGKGFSVRRGVLNSTYSLILMSDADLSTPIEEVEKLFFWLSRGYDIAIGSRGLRESEILERQPWYRQNMGRVFNLFVKMLVLGGINDTQCGFKLFPEETAKKLFSVTKIDGFAFDVEILFLARKSEYKIKEVPVRWINSPSSKVRILQDSFLMFFDLIRIRAFH
jgi:dolichyl-phosphate beta-glucosyltransferase